MKQNPVTDAVIIPHFNDVERLSRCLAALMPQVSDAVEIVVVDNNSSQPLDGVRADYPDVRFLIEPGKGAAIARNRGVAETTAPGLIFLDADCVPESGWLDQARNLRQDNTVIGGRIIVFDETTAPRSGAEAFETVFAFNQEAYIAQKGFSVTANLITTRDVFDATGPFTAGVSEDADWCHRATAGGAKLIYASDLVVRHPTRRDWPALKKKWCRLTQEMFELQGKSAGKRLRWAVRAAAMPASILVHAPKIFSHPGLTRSERWRAFRTLSRLRLTRCAWMLDQAVSGSVGCQPTKT